MILGYGCGCSGVGDGREGAGAWCGREGGVGRPAVRVRAGECARQGIWQCTTGQHGVVGTSLQNTELTSGRRELQREKAWSRIHLVPLLLAESDRDVYRRDYAALEREREIMKDVPGWEVRSSSPSTFRPVLTFGCFA